MSKQEKPVVLIMAGGRGERFWPRSRGSRPKQLQKVYSSKTLLQETWDRALTITSHERIFVGCNAALKQSILETHPEIPPDSFVVEPQGKNTAPIVALAALELEKRFPDTVQVVLSADHFIAPLDEFASTLERAIQAAREENALVTLGVPPTRPETGYGYIHADNSPDAKQAAKPYLPIQAFVEKPDQERAADFIARDDHFWNSGMFIWKGSTILEEFRAHAPAILGPIQQSMESGEGRDDRLAEAFESIPAEPVDTAIMEKSKRVVMVPASFRWDDVGSWLSLERILEKDADGNILVSESDSQVVGMDSSNNIILSGKEVVALLGVNDTVLVEEQDLLFLASRNDVGRIKELIAKFKENPSLQKYLM